MFSLAAGKEGAVVGLITTRPIPVVNPGISFSTSFILSLSEITALSYPSVPSD
jgi:hypothetical protein